MRTLETRGKIAVPYDFKHRFNLASGLLFSFTLALDFFQNLTEVFATDHLGEGSGYVLPPVEDPLDHLLQVLFAHYC